MACSQTFRSTSRLFGLLNRQSELTLRGPLARMCSAETKKPEENVSDGEEKSLEKLLAEKEILLEAAKKDVADFKDKYVRSLAECENVRRRGVKMTTDAKSFAIQNFSKDLLEVADILEKATESVPKDELSKNEHLKGLYDGLVMTETQLQRVFSKHGLEKINPVDEKFDPNFHEALFQQPIPGKEKGTVFMVEKIGYILNGRAVRAALVGVTQ